MHNSYIPYIEILNEFPISENDILLVASDISKLALIALRQERKFSPDVLIDSFQKKICSGTLLLPAFTDYMKPGYVFDIKASRPTTGAMSDTAFKRNDFTRTTDPFHSFFVWGKHQKTLSEINNTSTFGQDSVFAFLYRNNAKMLLIDIDLQHSFTFAHYVEEQEQVKYRHYKKYKIDCVLENGSRTSKEFIFFEKKDGISNSLNDLEKPFEEKDISLTKNINSIPVKIISLGKAFDYIQSEIRNNKGKGLYTFSSGNYIKSKIRKILK